LKKVGLFTRRLGKAGKGLAVDQATVARIHDLAAAYGGVGLDLNEDNLQHCSSKGIYKQLATTAGAAATHAAIAASRPRHDCPARSARRGVAHIVHTLHRIGRVVHSAILEPSRRRQITISSWTNSAACRQIRRNAVLGWCTVFPQPCTIVEDVLIR
jgi:hypothetical protein